MKCPQCDIPLALAERQGIEIDYCPQCRGVWLDRGELDKIIEKSNEPGSRKKREFDEDDFRKERTEYAGDYYKNHPGKYHKKKSILGELFDF
jgi:Zn-finger nucleic acid-binding protein